MTIRTTVVAMLILVGRLHAQTATSTKPNPIPVVPNSRVALGMLPGGLKFDFPSLEIGMAEYDDGPTGTTVFYFPKGVSAAVDVRGGAAGTIGTDFLRLSYPSQFVDVIVFSGGSSYGLSAATGVAEEIKSERSAAGDWGNIATVAGAIVFDLGGRRFNAVTPDTDLGRAAFRARRSGWFPQGNYGAGRFTTQGGFFGDSLRQNSGQGGAFRQIGPTRIAVFTVVNALGTVVDRSGSIVRCGRTPRPRICGSIVDRISSHSAKITEGPASKRDSTGVTSNTTLTIVVTNQKLPQWALQRLAVQVHTSMARAIQPYSTENDGDVLFAVSTQEVDNPRFSPPELGFVASEVAWDAVLASVPSQVPLTTRDCTLTGPRTFEYTGSYAFSPTLRATVRADGGRLFLDAPSGLGIYMPKGKSAELVAMSSCSEFLLSTNRGDAVTFLQGPNDTMEMTVNPPVSGHKGWPVRAQRISK